MIDYSVVIPVYNSSNSLYELAERIDKVFVSQKLIYELIFIDDGSSNPDTARVLEDLKTNFSVKVHHLMRNFGKPAAVLCGFHYARGQYIITMDDDLQHLPEDIPALIKAQQHDVVIGQYKKSSHGLKKRLASKIKNSLDYYFLRKPKGIKSGPFKLIKKEVALAAASMQTPNPMISALLYYCTNDIVNIPVNHGKRSEGKSGYTFSKGFKQLSKTLFSNSAAMLKLVTFIGLFLSLISIVVGGYYLVKKYSGAIDIKGWTSTFVIISFSSGVLLFAVGIIGEYLIRIIHGVENRPTYIIRKDEAKDRDQSL